MLSFQDGLPNGLKDAEKNILLLRYQEQMSYAEIAQQLGISQELGRTRLHRAKKHYA